MGLIDETELKTILLWLNFETIRKLIPDNLRDVEDFDLRNRSPISQCNSPFLTLYLLFPFSSFSFSCSASVFRYSSKGWVLDQTSFFVMVDSNIQRFKDLLEVRMFPLLTHSEAWTRTETHRYGTTLWIHAVEFHVRPSHRAGICATILFQFTFYVLFNIDIKNTISLG